MIRIKGETDRYSNGSSSSSSTAAKKGKPRSRQKKPYVDDVIDLCASDSDDDDHRRPPPRKPKKFKQELNDSSYSDDSEDTSYASTSKRRHASNQSFARLYAVAKILTLATDSVDSVSESESKLASVDSGVFSRIKKSLALAKHAGTGEAEARQALRLATRLMSSQNLTQADLLASSDAATNQQRAGMSEVAILSQTAASPRNESWVNQVAVAINLFFDVKAYSTSYDNRTKLSWTFYGLAVNTVAAAYAFEMVHNQVLTWATEKSERKEVHGKTGKNSYCQGVAAGLIALAKKEKKEELKIATQSEAKRLKQAEVQETLDRKKQTDRLHHPLTEIKSEFTTSQPDVKPNRNVKLEDAPDPDIKPFAVKRSASEEAIPAPGYDYTDRDQEDSDDEEQWHDTMGGEDDIKPHFDEATEQSIIDLTGDDTLPDIKPPLPDINPSLADIKPKIEPKEEMADQAQWQSSHQLIQFRQDAEQIADEYLANQHSGLKLKKRARTTFKKDSHAFEQGKRDAKKIDVKRKRIEN